MSVIVRDDIQSRKCLYVFPDRTDDFFWDRFIVNDLGCGTFCNTCAVKGGRLPESQEAPVLSAR